MSVQFGRWKFEGEAASPEYLAKVRAILSPYGPDGEGSYSEGGVDVLYHAFHTFRESRSETQPHVCANGVVITWDGRLDNRDELIGILDGVVSARSADVSIVSAALERWGTSCFSKLIGDWALSVWDRKERALILARDPIGSRHLYYAAEHDGVTWSSVLDPLVASMKGRLTLDEEYIAGWLAMLPATHVTPYAELRAVPPSCFMRFAPQRVASFAYWDFDGKKRIRYRNNREYEEHFRFAFRQSVRRRLRSDAPVLAELSGGVDSSSIVCVADEILARGGAEAPALRTLSYFDDAEPNWNERPYFTLVEQQRGREGFHIAANAASACDLETEIDELPATPLAPRSAPKFAACVNSSCARVLLSGIGGDEVTGGIATPAAELADLLTRAKLRILARQLKLWALAKRKPWHQLLTECVTPFFSAFRAPYTQRSRPPWLSPEFVRRERWALAGYPVRWTMRGALPSFQETRSTIQALQRQIGCLVPDRQPLLERRFPYLDRDLLEFLGSIPPEQLARPGQRRFLMRCALAGIVPEEILAARRKASVARAPQAALTQGWDRLAKTAWNLRSSALGIIEPGEFLKALDGMRAGQPAGMVPVLRALALERWLRGLELHGFTAYKLTRSSGGRMNSPYNGSQLRTPRRKGGERNEICEA